MVDDCGDGVVFINPEIESSGIPFKISSIAGRTVGVSGLEIIGGAAENIGNGNPYVEIGNGWDGPAGGALKGGRIGISGSASGTTSMLCTVWAKDTTKLRIEQDNCVLLSPTARYILSGTGNQSTFIAANHSYFGANYPWVTVNGATKTDAGPTDDCLVDPSVLCPPINGNVDFSSGTTGSICLSATQGGWCPNVAFSHSAATTFTNLTDAVNGMVITMWALNGNTTIKNAAGGTGQFHTASGSDLALTALVPTLWRYDTGKWYQVSLS